MDENIIQIPRAGTDFFEAKEFYDDSLNVALTRCQADGRRALFMPEIIDARIALPKESRIWSTWYSSQSIKATGKTKQGNAIVIHAHVPNYFSNLENIEKAIKQGVRNGAGIMPADEFQRLLDLEDNKTVFVNDYDVFKNCSTERVPVEDALGYLPIIPFLGGKERAEAYLEKHKQFIAGIVGIIYLDDLHEVPVGRRLSFEQFDYTDFVIIGRGDFHNGWNYCKGRFLGVHESNEDYMRRIKAPGLEQIIK